MRHTHMQGHTEPFDICARLMGLGTLSGISPRSPRPIASRHSKTPLPRRGFVFPGSLLLATRSRPRCDAPRPGASDGPARRSRSGSGSHPARSRASSPKDSPRPATAFATQFPGTGRNETAQRRGCEYVLGPKTLIQWDAPTQAGIADAELQNCFHPRVGRER
jgi:hypothetical protein